MRSSIGLLLVFALLAASCGSTSAPTSTSSIPNGPTSPTISTTGLLDPTPNAGAVTTTTFSPGLPSGQRGCGSLEPFYYAADLAEIAAQPVILAAIRGDTDLLGELLATGSDPDEINNYYGQTGLTVAIESDCYEAVDLLLTAGASPDAWVPEIMWSPLQMAVRRQNTALVERLLRLGADVNAVGPEMETALTLAANRGAPSTILEILLEAGADIEHRGLVGTAIEAAVSSGSLESVALLFKAGAEPVGAVYEAVAVDELDILKYLLNQGISIDVAPPSDAFFLEKSLLARAEATGRTEIAQFLRDLGAK